MVRRIHSVRSSRRPKANVFGIKLLLFFLPLLWSGCFGGSGGLGDFSENADIGEVQSAGTASYEGSTGRYTLEGGGENIWGSADAFHFLWKKTRGDLVLTTEVEFPEEGANPHRKAGWMVRQSLAPDAPYADAVIHADGLISLQYRKVAGGETFEIQSPLRAPAMIRLERTEDLFTLSVSKDGMAFSPAGSVLVPLSGEPYVGLALCAHEAGRIEKAIFSNVSLTSQVLPEGEERVVESTLETFDTGTEVRSIVYRSIEHFEAPNWSPDGEYFVINSQGRLYRLPVRGGIPEEIDTGFAVNCNNDHGFSPDGTQMAISDQTEGPSRIYVLPAEGGEPRLVTQLAPSYWHGWSPDGTTLAYCAERNGEYDIYTIPLNGWRENRLTRSEGLDDGPDYTPDGRFIYINSIRTGEMRIWRITPDGSIQEQVTFDDEYGDWFPHPSPDGEKLVFLSYNDSVEGHPANKEVALRMISSPGDKPEVVAQFFGGQGTINVPSWSPDSRQFAFVSYRLVIP